LKNQKLTYTFILIFTLAWCALIVLAPVLKHYHKFEYSVFIYTFFSEICHQMPERSFYLFGEKLAVCQRCTAIYFSFLLGVILYPISQKYFSYRNGSKLVFIIPLAVLLSDFLLGFISSMQNIFTILISGSIFGFSVSLIIVSGIMDTLNSNFNKKDLRSGRELSTN
jgi:uncharacterized membrane protein